jgi:hypothetical protein
MAVTDMVTMHVRNQNDIDAAESGIAPTGDGSARVIEETCSIGVLENQGAVEATEFPIMAADWGYLDSRRQDVSRYQKDRKKSRKA